MHDSPVAMMDQVVALGERGQPLPPEAAAWLAGWWRTYKAQAEGGTPISMERAAGLGAPGRPNWTKRQVMDERDAALRELYRTRFLGMDPRPAARAILALKLPEFAMVGERRIADLIREVISR